MNVRSWMNGRRTVAVIVCGLLALVPAACSDDSESTPTTASTTTTAEVPNPTPQVLFTYMNSAPFLRFAALISNPGSRPLVGVKTVWKALDANGVIVGSVDDREVQPIPAGGSVLDVGGAGGVLLKGEPVSFKLEVESKGSFTETLPDATVSTEGATFQRAESDLESGARDYEVRVTVAALSEVITEDLSVSVILKDAAGTVIGADFGDTIDLPARLSAGERVVVPAIVSVRNGEPATVEAASYS